MQNEFVSVIVPIYNVEKYLCRCIDSIINQTYKNLQIILIDDGATDDSGKICDEYAGKDQRITIVHKQNGGLSDARNAGLELVTGNYITFIDSDDYVLPNYIEGLVYALREHDADISVCGEERFVEEKNGSIKTIGSPYRKVKGFVFMSAEDALANYMRQDLFDASSCGKLYKSEFFKDVRFPVNRAYEDVGTTYKTFLKAKNVVYYDGRAYFYFQREGSILHSRQNTKRFWDGIAMAEEQLHAVEKKSNKLKKAAKCRCLSMYFHVLVEAYDSTDDKLIMRAWNGIKAFRLEILRDNCSRRKTRSAALLSFFGKKATVLIYRLFEK